MTECALDGPAAGVVRIGKQSRGRVRPVGAVREDAGGGIGRNGRTGGAMRGNGTVPALALVALLAAGCTAEVPGAGRPAAPEVSAPAPGPTGDLATVDLCALVPADRLTDLGLDPTRARPGDTPALRTCTWAPDPAAGEIVTPVVLTVLAGSDLDQLIAASEATGPAAGTVRRTEVAGRTAAELAGPVCTVFVEVDGGVVSVLGGSDCAVTTGLAEAAVQSLG